MRLSEEIRTYWKQAVKEKLPWAKLYLFGSRTDDNSLGGDIDLMILSDTLVDKKVIRNLRVEFYKNFGWQKVDIVNFKTSDESVFKQLIQKNAIEL